jgi:tellurium resistance protein TerD
MCCSPHTRKGGNISLSARAQELKTPGLTGLTVGLGWNPRTNGEGGSAFDLDASAIGLDKQGKVLSEPWFVFFNNLRSPNDCIVHTGDNLDGTGFGDDEQLLIDLTRAPDELNSIIFPVSIYDAETRQQNFGLVDDAYIRLLDSYGNTLTRYDLQCDASGEIAMVFGQVYRTDKLFGLSREWKFRAIGQGYDSGLKGIANDYGIVA